MDLKQFDELMKVIIIVCLVGISTMPLAIAEIPQVIIQTPATPQINYVLFNSTILNITNNNTYYTTNNITNNNTYYVNLTTGCAGGYVLQNISNNIGQCVLQSQGNLSWNQTFADGLYYPLSNPSGYYNITNAPTYKNDTWAGNQSNYYNKSQVDSNLTNGLNLKTNFSSFNSTQFSYSGGYINIFPSWINGLWCSLTGCSMKGNINMGTNNLTNVSYIRLNNVTGSCDLTINHSICSNMTGSYWVG